MLRIQQYEKAHRQVLPSDKGINEVGFPVVAQDLLLNSKVQFLPHESLSY